MVLEVAADVQRDANYFDKVDTRMGGVGPCARRWLLSKALCLDAWYEEMRSDPTIPKYYSSGYKRFGVEVRRYLATLAVMTYPVENFIVEMLEDDRLLALYDHLCLELEEQIGYVANLSLS